METISIISIISIVILITSVLIIIKFIKKINLMNEKFQGSNSRNMASLWQYLNTINENYEKNETLRGEITKEITEHYSEVEKYRMGKRIAKPL